MEEIKVPLDSTALISLNKCYMTEPQLMTDDLTLNVEALLNGNRVDAASKMIGNPRHNPDGLYPWVQKWVDDASDVTKRDYAWGMYLKYMVGFMNQMNPNVGPQPPDAAGNPRPPITVPNSVYEFGFGFNGVTWEWDGMAE